MILHAMAQPIPADNSGAIRGVVRTLTAEADDYTAGVTLLRDQLAEGERIVALVVDR